MGLIQLGAIQAFPSSIPEGSSNFYGLKSQRDGEKKPTLVKHYDDDCGRLAVNFPGDGRWH